MKKIFIIKYQPKEKSEKAEYVEIYKEEARNLGHEVREINIHNLSVEYLSIGKDGLPDVSLSDELKQAQDNIIWADQILLVYPVWCIGLPAKFKAFIERVFQKDILIKYGKMGPEPVLKAKTLVVMQSYSMPYFFMKYFYGDIPFKMVKIIFQSWCGFKIKKRFDFDVIDSVNDKRKQKWIKSIKKFVKTIN